MSPEPRPTEAERRADAIDDLIRQIADSNGADTEWWNYRTHEELGGLTPTQAWLKGDHEGVRRLIDNWYAASERAVERYRNDPEFMAMLRQKSKVAAEQAERTA